MGLFLEVAVEKTLKALAVTSLVLCHLVNGVVDSIEVKSLCTLCNAELVGTCTRLSHHALLKVGLSVPNNVAKKLCKLSSVLSLFPSIALESLSNLGLTLAVGLARHSKIHTHLSALTVEVSVKVLNHFLVAALCNTYLMLAFKSDAAVLNNFLELACRNLTLRAEFGSCITFVNVTTYCTNKFLCHF